MPVKTIKCKSVLTKSNLPKVDYCINPYVGCLHDCVYCYARFMKRFTNHSEKWGRFLDVKINAPKVLAKELARRPKQGIVLLGSVTDAYQPAEGKYQLTRKILEVLLKHDFPVSILTKSDLITRDIDLLKQFSNCEVGLTITTLDEKVAKDFEPYSSTPQERLKALEVLHDNGITTYAFIGPILPGLTELESIFNILKNKVDFVMAESLNLKCGNVDDIQNLLREKYPELLGKYHKGFNKEYWEMVRQELVKLSQDYEIPLRGFFCH